MLFGKGVGEAQDLILLQNTVVAHSLEAEAATIAPIAALAFGTDIRVLDFAGVSIESYNCRASMFNVA
jgi:hypothetical protein